MEVMYAQPRWQVLGRSLSEVFPAAFAEEFYRVRQNPGIHNLYKFRLGTPTGETRIVNVAMAPLVTRKFNVVGRLVIMDDITERIELEVQLTQADKLSSIGLLAAGVAHEVNTPLAVISSYTQMLAKQLQTDPQKAALLEKITKQTFRASEIVNNLLNFSRTTGTELTEISLNKVIADTLALLDHQFKVAHIQVQAGAEREACRSFWATPGACSRSSLNLFLNAKDAMNGGGVAERGDVERRIRQRPRFRHRLGHRAGAHSAHLRSIFHHQDVARGRPESRHRSWTLRHLRHHPGTRGQYPRGEPPGRRHHLHPGFSP